MPHRLLALRSALRCPNSRLVSFRLKANRGMSAISESFGSGTRTRDSRPPPTSVFIADSASLSILLRHSGEFCFSMLEPVCLICVCIGTRPGSIEAEPFFLVGNHPLP